MQSLFKSVSHRFHLIVVCFALRRIHIEFLRCKVAKLWILFFHSAPFLTPSTFIKKISLEESFKFHDDNWKINPLETLGQDFTKQAHNTLVKRLIVLRIILDDTLELDKAVDIVS